MSIKEIDKKTIGSSAQGLIHTSYLDTGWESTAGFLNAIQLIVNYWLLQISFSIGIRDTIPRKDTINQIKASIEEARKKVKEITRNAKSTDSRQQLDRQPGQSVMSAYESHIKNELSSLNNDASRIASQEVNDENNFHRMFTAGSKGDANNMMRIMCLLGQITVEGGRVKYMFKRRTLPHFQKDDYRKSNQTPSKVLAVDQQQKKDELILPKE